MNDQDSAGEAVMYETVKHERKVVGSNYLWHISSDGEFVATAFTHERVMKLETDHTVFIRCRSFQEPAEHGGAGYAVASSLDRQQSWKLGICAYNHPDLLHENKVLVFEWNRELAHRKEKGPAIPDYCFADASSWKKHFTLKCIDVEKKAVAEHYNFCYLNQVSGPRPSQGELTTGLVNKIDGGYQSSPNRPDSLFPHLPGFKCYVNTATRHEVLGRNYSLTSHKKTATKGKGKKRNETKGGTQRLSELELPRSPLARLRAVLVGVPYQYQ
jgi:hypothetical protein